MKKKYRIGIFIAGFVISLIGLWGGSYLIHVVPNWAGFAAFATALGLTGIGVLAMFVAVSLEDIK